MTECKTAEELAQEEYAARAPASERLQEHAVRTAGSAALMAGGYAGLQASGAMMPTPLAPVAVLVTGPLSLVALGAGAVMTPLSVAAAYDDMLGGPLSADHFKSRVQECLATNDFHSEHNFFGGDGSVYAGGLDTNVTASFRKAAEVYSPDVPRHALIQNFLDRAGQGSERQIEAGRTIAAIFEGIVKGKGAVDDEMRVKAAAGAYADKNSPAHEEYLMDLRSVTAAQLPALRENFAILKEGLPENSKQAKTIDLFLHIAECDAKGQYFYPPKPEWEAPGGVKPPVAAAAPASPPLAPAVAG